MFCVGKKSKTGRHRAVKVVANQSRSELERGPSARGVRYQATPPWLSAAVIVAALAGCRGGSASPDAGAGGSAGAAVTATGGVGGKHGIGTGGIGAAGAGGAAAVGAGGAAGGNKGSAGIGGGAGGGGVGGPGIGGASPHEGSSGTGAGGSAGVAGNGGGGAAGGTTAAGGATPVDAGAGDSGDAKVLPPITDGRAPDAAICVGLAQLKLGAPMWTVNENNTFVERAPAAGVRSRLVIPLSNPTSSTTTTSPAILLTSTTPGVSGTGRYELFGIAANQTASLIWLIDFAPPLAAGSTVHFQADVYGQDMGRFHCEDSPTITFDVTLN